MDNGQWTMDNFEIIRNFLQFELPESLYRIQILQRRKDIPTLSVTHKVCGYYYIRTLQDLDNIKESIINECEQTCARAYIDLNAKDVKKVALLALKKTAELIYDNNYDGVSKVYEHACGNAPTLGQKLWLIDIDTQDSTTITKVKHILSKLNAVIRLELPSKTGMHMITLPFPTQMFPKIEHVDIIKHGVTILYACRK